MQNECKLTYADKKKVTMKKLTKICALIGAAAMIISAGACGSAKSSDANGSTQLTIWHYWDGANADTFDAMVKDFNASHKNIKIKTASVPNSDFMTKLRASASSKSLPDISISDLVWVPQIAKMGNLTDLSKVISSKTLDDVTPALIDYGHIDGKQVSVPVTANNLAYMYNKDVYKEAGLDPNKPPQTWDELKKVAKIIKEKTGKPGYDLLTQAGDNGEGLTWNFQVNLWQAGGEFLTKDNSKAAFNTPQGKKAMNFWMDLIKSGVSPYAKWGEFEKGKGGSAQEGSWMVGIWAPDPPFDFGVAKAPHPKDGKEATNLGGEQAIVFHNSDARAKAAGEFLNWFLQPEQVIKWSQKTGMLPVTKSVAKSDKYLDWVKKEQPRLIPFVEQMEIAHTRPNTPLYPKISFEFAKAVEKAFAGEQSVDEALANAEKAVNDVIAKG